MEPSPHTGSHYGTKPNTSLNTNTSKSNICDKVMDCENISLSGHKNNSKSEALDSAGGFYSNSVLFHLPGHVGIWTSVLDSPRHLWPANFAVTTDRASSAMSCTCMPAHPLTCTCVFESTEEVYATSWGSGSLSLSSSNPWSGANWLPISPRTGESHRENDVTTSGNSAGIPRPTSRLWDVNLQKQWDFESPRERCPTIENIQRYLINLQ